MDLRQVALSVWEQILFGMVHENLHFVEELVTEHSRTFRFRNDGQIPAGSDIRQLTQLDQDVFWTSFTAGKCTFANVSLVVLLHFLLERGVKIRCEELPGMHLLAVCTQHVYLVVQQEILRQVDGQLPVRLQHLPSCSEASCRDPRHKQHTVCRTLWAPDAYPDKKFDSSLHVTKLLDLTGPQLGHFEYLKHGAGRVPFAMFNENFFGQENGRRTTQSERSRACLAARNFDLKRKTRAEDIYTMISVCSFKALETLVDLNDEIL